MSSEFDRLYELVNDRMDRVQEELKEHADKSSEHRTRQYDKMDKMSEDMGEMRTSIKVLETRMDETKPFIESWSKFRLRVAAGVVALSSISSGGLTVLIDAIRSGSKSGGGP